MSILSPLKSRPIRLLWSGQFFSCVGDEVYAVALIWLAADLVGANAGYVGAVESAALFIAALFIAHIADRWDERRLMIWVDIVRGIAVLLPPILMMTFSLSMWTLLPLAFVVAGLEGFFRPAMLAVLPRITGVDYKTLHQTNALMSTTERLGRVVGPTIVAILSQFLPIIHFFTANAVSFFASSFFIWRIKDERMKSAHLRSMGSVKKSWNLVKQHRAVKYYMLTSGASAAFWYMAHPLGVSLMMKLELQQNIAQFGQLMACYGIGNIIGSICLGSFSFGRPEIALSIGRALAGIGFIGTGLLPEMWMKMIAMAAAAIGGPISDVPYQTMIQQGFPTDQQAGVYRLHIGYSRIWIAVGYLLSPLIFSDLAPSTVIAILGVLILGLGCFGLWYFRSSPTGERETLRILRAKGILDG